MPKWLPYAAFAVFAVFAADHHRRGMLPAESAVSQVQPAVHAPEAGQAHPNGHAHWAYEGADGPEHWGELDPAYAECAKGTHQTPIDIHGAADVDLPPLAIDYRTLGQEVVNNGHTIQVNVAPGSTLTLNGVAYELKQFHFHTPSENEIDERRFDIEAHLVHGDRDGHLAVIGVMYRLGAEDSAIARIWSAAPAEAGARNRLKSPIDPNTLLPKDRDYYAFEGSLTTPPCTEGVQWIVMKTPLTVSQGELAFFQKAMHGHNNRPVQGLHARAVLR